MAVQPVQLLDAYGPERCEALTVEQATRWCRRIALGRYENFSVLSALVPRERRGDFAAVYAFCRWADDLGDEVGDRARSLELLAWWRQELVQCFEGAPRHPVFVALAPVIARARLPIDPFDDLIRAFEQDQVVTRYDTWAQVMDYCRLSANPVGRLVLMVLGQAITPAVARGSDAICTALQLTNHWQDIRRDALERDRIYVPRELISIADFERRLVASARQGYAVDRTFLAESRALVKDLVDRTWAVWAEGDAIGLDLGRDARPIVWLLAAGGRRVLRLIEEWNYETVLHRPVLGTPGKLALVAAALVRRRLGLFGAKGA
jgi:squalene synthase HpnC